jgi:hypothetical protein
MDKKIILCLFLFCLGTFLTCYYSSVATFVGVFALLWANNISFFDQLKKGK